MSLKPPSQSRSTPHSQTLASKAKTTMNLPTIAEELAHNIANGSRGSRGGKSNQHDDSENEDLVSGDTISPKNTGDEV